MNTHVEDIAASVIVDTLQLSTVYIFLKLNKIIMKVLS